MLTSLELDQHDLDAKFKTGLTWKALVRLGFKYLQVQKEGNERITDLELSNNKLTKVVHHLEQQLWDIKENQKDKQPMEEQ